MIILLRTAKVFIDFQAFQQISLDFQISLDSRCLWSSRDDGQCCPSSNSSSFLQLYNAAVPWCTTFEVRN